MAFTVRADAGADSKPDRTGIYAREKNPPVPLRPPGLPLALVPAEGKTDWSAEYDAWGNVLRENNPHNMKQLIRLPGQQCDEETGLYYNRHRYYDPLQGRYITQDPIGLMGGWNGYVYPLDPVQFIDPLGLNACDLAPEPTALCGNPLFTGGMGPNKMLNELGPKGGFNGSGTMLGTGVIGGGIVGATKGQVDNAGRSVNPLADILTQEHKSGVNPGGNCTPDELDKLQKQKDAFCNMPRSCSKNDSKFDLINKMNINLACAHTRKNINNKCFFGGDKTHMDQENDAFKSSVNCRGLLNGIK